MSTPAKKYSELSGCMTCNTKLTVFNPRLEPESPRQTHTLARSARGTERPPGHAGVVLGRLEGKSVSPAL